MDVGRLTRLKVKLVGTGRFHGVLSPIKLLK